MSFFLMDYPISFLESCYKRFLCHFYPFPILCGLVFVSSRFVDRKKLSDLRNSFRFLFGLKCFFICVTQYFVWSKVFNFFTPKMHRTIETAEYFPVESDVLFSLEPLSWHCKLSYPSQGTILYAGVLLLIWALDCSRITAKSVS